MVKILVATVIIFILSGCEENPSQPIEVTSKIYVELLIAEERYAEKPDSLQFYQQKVFDNYNSSKEKYEKNLELLEYNNDKWTKFFELSEAYIDTLRNNRSK